MVTYENARSALRSAHESLAACDLDMLTHRELLSVLDELEVLSCALPAQWHRERRSRGRRDS